MTQNVLRIGYLSTLYHTSILIKGSRWLENDGLEVKWSLFGTGPAIVDAFSKGELDIGYIGLAPTVIGVGKGVQIKCIAGGHVEGTIFSGKKEYKPIEEFSGDMGKALNQFRGKKIGVPRRGSLHDVFLRYYLSQSGIEEKVDIVNYDWADMIPDAMIGGEIEGAVGTPPLSVLLHELLGTKLIIPPSLIWPDNPSYGVVTSKRMLEESQELLLKFLKMHKRACKMIRDSPKEAADVVSKTIELVNSKFVLDTYAVSPRYCSAISKEYVKSTLDMLPVLQRLGYLKGKFEESDIFDSSLIRDLHPEPPHYHS